MHTYKECAQHQGNVKRKCVLNFRRESIVISANGESCRHQNNYKMELRKRLCNLL